MNRLFGTALVAGLGLLSACKQAYENVMLETLPRPQTPVARDYDIRDVVIPGGAPDVRLAGELTLPRGDGPFPGIVLVSGSEVVDRNSKLLGHRPFLVLSDFLTRHGYAVFRHDDRGFGRSTGDAATATDDDFAADAAAALKWLRHQPRIDPARAGFIGHSQGGIKAPIAAATERPDFMVLLASGVTTMAETLLLQHHDFERLAGRSDAELARLDRELRAIFEILRTSDSIEAAHRRLRAFAAAEGAGPAQAEKLAAAFATPWMMAELDRPVAPIIAAYDGPVLALYANKDLFVSAAVNAPLTGPLLRHPASEVVVLSGLNHMFQPAERGDIEEIWQIETTMDAKALDTVLAWLNRVTG